jgi:PKD repeat protein
MRMLRGLLVLGIVGLAACAGEGQTGSDASPANNPPTAAFTTSCDGLTCEMTDGSTDADGTIQSRAWDFGDGGTSTEANPTHTYADEGTFSVRLTVTDDGGDTGTVTRGLTVPPIPTMADYSGTYERKVPHTLPERQSRYVLHEDGRFELHDTLGTDSTVYLGRWALYDLDEPWIDMDFDDFPGGDCVPEGLPYHGEGTGVFFEISGATHLSMSYCGNWYFGNPQGGDLPEEGFYARAEDPGIPGPPPAQAGQLAFVRDGQIHLANTDGSGVVRVSEGPGDAEPAWSPDGRQIAFSRSGGAAPGIYVMDADGSNPVRRTTSGLSPTWSSDGQSLAFACENQHALCSVDVDGVTDPVAVWPPSPAPLVQFPAWSPDGSRIAFTTDWQFYETFFDIFAVAPDGSGFTVLTAGIHRVHVHEFYQSAWSPDGQRLAFVTCPWAFYYCSSGVVSVMSADGTGLELLAAVTGFARPTWSPDGQTIAFSSANAIEWISADGSERGMILADGHSPAWHP